MSYTIETLEKMIAQYRYEMGFNYGMDYRLWQVEVCLGMAVIQRQLLHSSAGGVVSFIYRYSIVELFYLSRLDFEKSGVSWE
ncbi:hypothetical protein HAX54_038046, partial [Datura stramonium]|nr:hypothetical protein [Datura stramonium]